MTTDALQNNVKLISDSDRARLSESLLYDIEHIESLLSCAKEPDMSLSQIWDTTVNAANTALLAVLRRNLGPQHIKKPGSSEIDPFQFSDKMIGEIQKIAPRAAGGGYSFGVDLGKYIKMIQTEIAWIESRGALSVKRDTHGRPFEGASGQRWDMKSLGPPVLKK